MKCSIWAIALAIAILSTGGACAEMLLLKTGEKLDGDIIISYDRGVMFRERPEKPGRYYPYDEVARIYTKDGMLYYLMPRSADAHKKPVFSPFPSTRIILPTEKKIAPVPYVTLPRGDAVEVACSGAEDATTILLEGGTRVRLLGLAPPPRSAGKMMKRLAADYLSKRVAGKTVRLFPGPQSSGSRKIAEAYVVMDNDLLNAELIENGWSCASSSPKKHPYKEAFISLEKYAKNLDRGMWGGPFR
jgi:endonuclease YncB( thermonuclease family)